MQSLDAIADKTEWLSGFRARAAASRTPILATLELTRRCNLRCQHCYLGDHNTRRQMTPVHERSTSEILESLEEWAAAGVLQLVITGGDPMVRSDFCEIYQYAAELGMLLTVFCDAILVNDAILAVFEKCPPRVVEVSIYGATPETYEKVTRIPGSHALAWRGIHLLLGAGIRVTLKTVLMTINEAELGEMAAQADRLGCGFRFDAAIFPCLPDGATDPLNLRVSPESAVEWDLAFPERRQKWIQALSRPSPPELREGAPVYNCGAGVTGFYADSCGNLSPCLMTTHYRYKSAGGQFDRVWKEQLVEIRKRRRTRDGGCLGGAMRNACTHCPAFNFLETGDEEQDSPYMEKTARLRMQAIMNHKKEGL